MSAPTGPGPKVALVAALVPLAVALIDVLMLDNDVTPSMVVTVVFLYHLWWGSVERRLGGERT